MKDTLILILALGVLALTTYYRVNRDMRRYR